MRDDDSSLSELPPASRGPRHASTLTAAVHSFLIHRLGDHVGVAVRDVDAGERAVAVYLDDESTVENDVAEAVPLGHKVTVADVEAGAPVLKYGLPIGTTPDGFRRGHYVHTHNLRSARW